MNSFFGWLTIFCCAANLIFAWKRAFEIKIISKDFPALAFIVRWDSVVGWGTALVLALAAYLPK